LASCFAKFIELGWTQALDRSRVGLPPRSGPFAEGLLIRLEAHVDGGLIPVRPSVIFGLFRNVSLVASIINKIIQARLLEDGFEAHLNVLLVIRYWIRISIDLENA